MNIYSRECDCLHFNLPRFGRQLLDDSIERTDKGCDLIGKGVGVGLCHILLARVESAAALAFVAIATLFHSFVSLFLTPLFLVPAALLNLAARLPGISSCASAEEWVQSSGDLIYRTLRVHLIGIPVIFLFMTAAAINLFLPAVLGPQNLFFETIDGLVEPLGPFETLSVSVEGGDPVQGTKTELSLLSQAEEFLRTLSSKNTLREERVDSFTHVYTRTR